MEEITIKQAMDKLAEELSKDKSEGSYYYSWQSNIAMSFVDDMDWYLEENNPSFKDEVQEEVNIPEVANNAAKRFLDTLIYLSE